MAVFDTDEFAWADVQVVIGGRNIVGIRGIRFKESDDDELIYGRGNRPIGIGSGNRSYEVEVKMTLGEKDALEKSLGINSILDIRFDVSVAYSKQLSGKQAFRYLRSVKISENEEDFNQGDKFMEVSLPGICLDIERA
ncbi:hypothetical protein MY04_4797 [Flammeovirga sp. MY04]|uniref:hypothetical protein n=1 Tax=Flammeovirga sp. MY04 TaxID=1191459 RepID=UPI000806444D|nr:hypothetical protein [Flammeovirga sp. MY04]ANQ49614.1 hypothetical protein MY04_2240 [Flammeovirga sp. MY04]ANQ52132.1 hypothetical protein MY04_4797 [Flammeovirga sp. MY04]